MTAINNEALGGIAAISAATMSLLGIPIHPVIWGFIGGIIGSGWAKPSTLIVGISTYFSASLLSALIGHAVAAATFNGNAHIGNAMSAGIAIFFHPLLSAIAEKVPEFVSGVLSLIGKRGQP